MTHWDDLETALTKVRESLDDADGTPLGRVGALLDGMARNTDRAIDIARRLREMDEDTWTETTPVSAGERMEDVL